MSFKTDNNPMESENSMRHGSDDILVVDDEIPNLRLLVELLEKEGYRVRPADKAQIAIDSAVAQPPGLILLDVRMPEIDGFEACRRLKQDKRTKDVPIIFISSLQDTEAKLQGFKAGGVDFISKPFEEMEILARVRTHTHLHWMQQHLEQLVKERTEELRKSEDRYKLVVDGSAVGIYDWDINSGRVYYSGLFKELLGYDAEEPWDRVEDIWNRIHPDDYQTVLANIERYIEKTTSNLLSHEFRLKTRSGEYRWYHGQGKSIWDKDGKCIQMAGSMTDITESKLAREKLLISEQRFRSLMEQSPLAIEILTPEGQITQVNSAWMRLWGVNEEEAAKVLEKYNMLTDKEAEARGVIPLIKKAFAGESVILPSIDYVCKKTVNNIGLDHMNPNTVCIQCHVFPVKNENHEIVFVVNTYVDITKLKQAQISLEESERKYRELVEDINDVIYSVDTKGNIAYISPAVKSILGYEPHELMGKHISNFVHSDDLQTVKKDFESSLADRATPADYRALKKDGSYIWIRVLSNPIKDDKNNIIGIRGVISDIAERKKAEEDIARQAKLLDLIFKYSLDSIVLLDKDYNFIWVSETYAKACQRDSSEFAGHNHFEFYPSNLKEEFDATKKEKSIYLKYARPFIFPDHPEWGTTYWDLGLVPIFDDDGEVEMFLFTLRDITKHKQAKETIQKSQDSLRFFAGKLITVQEEERRLLAREMHDDFTQRLALLAIEAGKLEIESQQDDSPMSTKLQEMKKKIIKLSKDIHDISRQIHPAILDDLGLVDAIKSECDTFTQREEIHVEYETKNVPSSIPKNVAICIYRITQESLRNIAKYAKTDKAFVSLIGLDGNLILTVRDYGIGFDTEQMHEQKGIGLISIEERTRLIQGEFSVQSKPGEGTVIEVKVPIEKEQK